MELSGEEQKLQALYSEVKAADEQAAPRFATVWNRAQLAPRRIRVFNPAFVAALMLLVFGVVGFAVWSRYSRTTSKPQPVVVYNPPVPANSTTGQPPKTDVERPTPKPNNVVVAPRRNKAATPRQAMVAAANRKLQKDAKSIANWQSPTSALLESPSDEIFSSLPEFNQSATQLKSFLPSRSN